MNHGMKESVNKSAQELRWRFAVCISRRIEISFLGEHIVFQGSSSPVLAKDYGEEIDICTIVSIKSEHKVRYIVTSMIKNPLFPTKQVIEIFDCDHPWACYSRSLICHMSLVCCIDYGCTSTQCVDRKKVMRSMTGEVNV
jgi:hypothetical protein